MDKNSTNGTLLNDAQVQQGKKTELRLGDTVTIGTTAMKIVSSEDKDRFIAVEKEQKHEDAEEFDEAMTHFVIASDEEDEAEEEGEPVSWSVADDPQDVLNIVGGLDDTELDIGVPMIFNVDPDDKDDIDDNQVVEDEQEEEDVVEVAKCERLAAQIEEQHRQCQLHKAERQTLDKKLEEVIISKRHEEEKKAC